MYSEFEVLKAFFLAFRVSENGKRELPQNIKIPGKQPAPLSYCFTVLKKFFPERFKEKSNEEILAYLKEDPRNRERLWSEAFAKGSKELTELEETLKEPVPAEESAQTAEQGGGTVEQPPMSSAPSPGPAGMPGIPSMGGMPSSSSRPFRIVRNNVPQVEKPEIVQATSTRAIKEAGNPSKLVTANSKGDVVGTQEIKSKVPYSVSNSAKNFNSAAQRFTGTNLGRIGEGFKNMFGNAANMGGRVGLNAINHGGNFFNNLGSRRARLGNALRNTKSKVTSGGGKKAAIALAGAFFLIFFMAAFNGATGTTPIGEAAPPPPGTTSDISTCKFTRAGNSQLIKSSILLGRISNTASIVGIPAQILASVAMHENQDFVANADNNHDAIKTNQLCNKGKIFCEKNGQVLHSIEGQDDPCTTDEISAGARTAQAIGLMQLLDIYNPGKDLCSITENLNIAATKLKTDGISSQPNQDQVNQAIHAYYNSCTYGNFSYCNEVWKDYQNCKTGSSGTVLPPPSDGNYQKAMAGFGIEMKNGFATDEYKDAFDILNKAVGMFPKFRDKIHTTCSSIVFEPTTDISHADGCTIPLTSGTGDTFFKYLIIHELAHKINTAAHLYNSSIMVSRTADIPEDTAEHNGFLTYYSEHAASDPKKICGNGDDNGNRADEEFADSVAYLINDVNEMNMHIANDEKGACGIKWNNENPYKKGTRFTKHKEYITIVLQQ